MPVVEALIPELYLLCSFYGSAVTINCSLYSVLTVVCFQCFDAVGWGQEGHPACKKTSLVGCWHGYLSGARCRFAYGPPDAIATHYLLLQQIQIGFTSWFYLSHTGSPG